MDKITTFIYLFDWICFISILHCLINFPYVMGQNAYYRTSLPPPKQYSF